MDLVKHLTKISNVEIVFMYVAEQLFAINTRYHLVHQHVSIYLILSVFSKRKEFRFLFIAKATPKQEVKACHQCNGADACKPEKLQGSEIRTSAALGASNLYCYTVCRKNYTFLYLLSLLLLNFNGYLFVLYLSEIRSKNRCCCCSWWFRVW